MAQNFNHLRIGQVFFCSMESSITFRTPTEEDFLGSMSSQRILSTLEEREVPLERFLGNDTSTLADRTEWILTDEHNLLNQWQSAGALEHFQSKQHFVFCESQTIMLLILYHSHAISTTPSGVERILGTYKKSVAKKRDYFAQG